MLSTSEPPVLFFNLSDTYRHLLFYHSFLHYPSNVNTDLLFLDESLNRFLFRRLLLHHSLFNNHSHQQGHQDPAEVFLLRSHPPRCVSDLRLLWQLLISITSPPRLRLLSIVGSVMPWLSLLSCFFWLSGLCVVCCHNCGLDLVLILILFLDIEKYNLACTFYPHLVVL